MLTTLSPDLYWHRLNSRSPASLPNPNSGGFTEQDDWVILPNCFGRETSWAESDAALSSAIPQTKSDSRRIPCYRLDTNRLPLVPGLFNWSGRRRTARPAFSRQI